VRAVVETAAAAAAEVAKIYIYTYRQTDRQTDILYLCTYLYTDRQTDKSI